MGIRQEIPEEFIAQVCKHTYGCNGRAMCDLSKDEQAQVRIIATDLWLLAKQLLKDCNP